MKTLFVITHIDAKGFRVNSFPNQGRNHTETKEEQDRKIAALKSNPPERLKEFFGPHWETLEAIPRLCYDHGDTAPDPDDTRQTYFPEYDLIQLPGKRKPSPV